MGLDLEYQTGPDNTMDLSQTRIIYGQGSDWFRNYKLQEWNCPMWQ